ncbi:MAG: hypothetical protein R3181_06960 [Rubricoccaceae bacterium]|nr:hypothetical protein [Rubricoccaceae bacterium]
MPLPACRALLVLLLVSSVPRLAAQPLADTLITWRGYSQEREARVRLFASGDERRPHTVVVDERADGARSPVTDEVRYVAETIGRTFGFDPVAATFVFRFTAAAFVPAAEDGGKALLLRATFRRGASGDLNAPSWRVLSRDALAELTDRALY